jgi:hypothetical protein
MIRDLLNMQEYTKFEKNVSLRYVLDFKEFGI